MEVMEILKNMTLRQKIGQMIIGQAEGIELKINFEQYVKKYPLCGYRINSSNTESSSQLKEFTESLKAISRKVACGIDPILGCDEEGGVLSVFAGLVTEFPGNMPLGATFKPELAYGQGNVLGYELSELGINLAFAPVADLNLQSCNPVIGVRSFGDDPKKVYGFCREYSFGLNNGGVAACAKHFPGHGNTRTDSHEDLPENVCDLKLLLETELFPFEMLAHNKIDSIMVSHVKFPNIASDNLPATLSPQIIQTLLRNVIGYDGVIFSDDMEMSAIVKNYSIKQAIRLFVIAGGDTALINSTRDAAVEGFESLLSAVYEGVISEERIDQSVIRILSLKQKIKTYERNRKKLISSSKDLSKEIGEKSVTLVRDDLDIIPLKRSGKVLILVPDKQKLSQADTSSGEIDLNGFLKKKIDSFDLIKLIPDNDSSHEEILEKVRQYDIVIQCTINCARFPEQAELANKISGIRPLIVLMLRDPYDILFLQEVKTVIATYSYSDSSLRAAVEAIFGDQEFSGKLPVKIY